MVLLNRHYCHNLFPYMQEGNTGYFPDLELQENGGDSCDVVTTRGGRPVVRGANWFNQSLPAREAVQSLHQRSTDSVRSATKQTWRHLASKKAARSASLSASSRSDCAQNASAAVVSVSRPTAKHSDNKIHGRMSADDSHGKGFLHE